MDAPAAALDPPPGATAASRPPPPPSGKIGGRRARGARRGYGMRISYKVFLVGGIPIAIAAAIALAAIMLLSEADRARSGAVLAGTIYRNLLSAGTTRDDFLSTRTGERTHDYELFLSYAEQARFDLLRLSEVASDPASTDAAKEATDALQRYRVSMTKLVDVTVNNDGLVADMAARADAMIKLTDAARDSEHQANIEILQSLADANSKLHSGAGQDAALESQITDLITRSVQSAATQRDVQNVASETLKLTSRAAAAVASRDTGALSQILDKGKSLSGVVSLVPIELAIRPKMVDALDAWRKSVAATLDGFNQQNRILDQMDATSRRMIDGARFLNETLTRNAERIGALVRTILVFGAAIGLFVGALTGLLVARSITRPLRLLQSRMAELSENARAGPIAGFERRDELGDMARATNVFITEIGRREQALRKSKDRADAALAELQKTQTDLIQAEKLASLGQLVAGVAHEINTPLGIALTTATHLGDEARRFRDLAVTGKLQRSVLDNFVERMRDGTHLLVGNLSRAADLVHSFRQVAADQASGERRPFLMDAWLQDLLTSLRPILRKTKHEVLIECPPGVLVDTYPGALGQVLTNLLTNALTHAYAPGEAGRLSIRVSEPRQDTIRIVFADDGRGIPPENVAKVFDPFFTTGRSTGNTGLGLHIVYNLVTSRLQGHVNLYSKVGRGTRFTIDIPKVVNDAAPEAVAEKRYQLEGA
jgi:signal transduction histidine kinase